MIENREVLFETMDVDAVSALATQTTELLSVPQGEVLDDALQRGAINIVSMCSDMLREVANTNDLKNLAKIITDMRTAFFKNESIVVNNTNNVQHINTGSVEMFKTLLARDI